MSGEFPTRGSGEEDKNARHAEGYARAQADRARNFIAQEEQAWDERKDDEQLNSSLLCSKSAPALRARQQKIINIPTIFICRPPRLVVVWPPPPQQSPTPLLVQGQPSSAMGNETVLESVQVFGRKVSWHGGTAGGPLYA